MITSLCLPRWLCRARPMVITGLVYGAIVASLASGAAAQLPTLEAGFMEPAPFGPGDQATFLICGEPGDVPVMIAGTHLADQEIPGIGTIVVSLGPGTLVSQLPPIPAGGKLRFTCLIDCPIAYDHAGRPLFMQFVTFDPQTAAATALSELVALDIVTGDCCLEARPAQPDPQCSIHGGGHALWLPGIATDLVFVNGGLVILDDDGTASITGELRSLSDPGKGFLAVIVMDDRVAPDQPTPDGAPKLELAPDCYYAHGGTVDPLTWSYYLNLDGTLTGLGDLAGAELHLTRHGPPPQVGYGASGKNSNLGLSAWIGVEVVQQPATGAALQAPNHGDINVDLAPCMEQY